MRALVNYERALTYELNQQASDKFVCESGLARCAVASGNVRRGIQLATRLKDGALMQQCAELLESAKVRFSKINFKFLMFQFNFKF